MGGRPKGLLPSDETGLSILERTLGLASQLDMVVVLVGEADPYRSMFPDLPVIADAPSGIGPLGGLSGVLCERKTGSVIALACDMPYLTLPLLERVAREAEGAVVLAARDDTGRWDPLCARYDAASVSPALQRAIAEGVRSFQQLFSRLTVTELPLSETERKQLVDWDSPEDMQRGR